MCGIGTSSMLRRSRCWSKDCHCSWLCTSSKFPWTPTLSSRTRLCTKPSRHALGAATRRTPKPPSCDHEQPALCRCPATAPGRAAPMATSPPNGIPKHAAFCHLARKTTDAHLWKWCVPHKTWRTSASDQPAKLSGSFGIGVMWGVAQLIIKARARDVCPTHGEESSKPLLIHRASAPYTKRRS